MLCDWGRYNPIPFLHWRQKKKEVGTRIHGNSHWTQKVYKDHWISAVTLRMRSRHAKDCTVCMQQSLEMETNLSFQSNKSGKGGTNSLKDMKNTHIDLMLLQDGGAINFLPQRIHLHLRHHDGNRAATCGQRGTGTRVNLHPWSEEWFFIVPEWVIFSLAGNLISRQSTGRCNKSTCRAHVFHMLILSACFVPACCHSCSVYSHIVTHWLHAHTWLKEHIVCVLHKNRHIFIAQCHTFLLSWAFHRARALLPYLWHNLPHIPLFSQLQPCADLRPPLSGGLAEPPSIHLYSTVLFHGAACYSALSFLLMLLSHQGPGVGLKHSHTTFITHRCRQ